MIHQDIVLKLSGEILGKNSRTSIAPQYIHHYVTEIKAAYQLGTQIAIVIGGGNIWRGKQAAKLGMSKEAGDYMGLLATVMNGIALHHALQAVGLSAVLMTRLAIPAIGEPYYPTKAKEYLSQRKIVVLAGGTGEPGCTTDSAATLAAIELEVDICIKGTQVDGVYTQDPKQNPAARLYTTLSLKEAIKKQLEVMDRGALKMCIANQMNIHVYNATRPQELRKVLCGEKVGTLLY
ncbi:MAG: UMP kinase [Bacteroidota bacterium]